MTSSLANKKGFVEKGIIIMSERDFSGCTLTLHFSEKLLEPDRHGNHYRHLAAFTSDPQLRVSDDYHPLNPHAPLPKVGEKVSVIDTLTTYEVIGRSHVYHESGAVELFIEVKRV